MAQAYVVGRQRKPGTVGLGDVGRDLVAHPDQIARAAVDALLWVNAVGYADKFGGWQGQHHQPAYAGGRARVRVPERFLITHGGQQAPVQPVLVAGLAQKGFKARQAILHMGGEGAGTHIVQYVGVAVKALDQLIQRAVGLDAREEAVDRIQQRAVGVLAQRPGHRLAVAQVKGNAHGRVKRLIDHQLVGIDHRAVDLAVVDQAQQVNHLNAVRLLKGQLRVALLQGAQFVSQGAALEYHQALIIKVFNTARLAAATPVDHLGNHIEIGHGKANLLAARRVDGQAGCRHVRTIGFAKLVVEAVDGVGGLHVQAHTQAVGKALGQLVFQPGITVAVLIEGGRRVAGDHAQGAVLLNLFQLGALLTGCQQHGAQGGGQSLETGKAGGWSMHGASIGKSALRQ